MNKQFLSILTKFEDYEFFCLEHHLAIARMVRNIMSQNAIDSKTMAERLNVNPKRMKEVLNGSYPFDLFILSKIQVCNQEIAYQKAKLKIEAESISFPAYEGQLPAWASSLQESIKKIEEKLSK